MDVLIDTQVLIWTQENNAAVSSSARAVLSNPNNTIYMTQINLFEIAIKLKIGKLPAFRVTVDELAEQMGKDGISSLN
jgi:PIN domain nuclease of toxin-antitoxin system